MAKFLWTQKQNFGPHARWAHAMVYDTARQRTLLFGGHLEDNDEFAGDTWEWDGETWVQVADIGPKGRYRHNMVYDSARQQIILYGGRVVKDGIATNETWEWDGIEWIQVADTGPLLEHGTMAMAYDKGRERIVLFGHLDQTRSETWEWDGDKWTQQEDTGPSARFYTTMAYDTPVTIRCYSEASSMLAATSATLGSGMERSGDSELISDRPRAASMP